jgi:hypothetical protein
MLDRTAIGGNNPPDSLGHAKEAMQELSAFLADCPVIETFDQAKQAGAWVERTRITLKEMKDEQDAKTAPFTEKLNAIYAAYRTVRTPLDKAYEVLKARVTAYNRAEEAKRAAEAQRLADIAAEAERAARAAEAAEQEAIANAEAGECSDVGEAIAEADDAFREYSVANRAAQRADRETKVRIPSAMGNRALAMRSVEVFTVEDACAAITIMGASDDLKKQIIRDAKRFREATGELPEGVTSAYERSL